MFRTRNCRTIKILQFQRVETCLDRNLRSLDSRSASQGNDTIVTE